jgi:hypothetical protein
MLAKRKHSILKRLNNKNIDQQKLVVRTNVQKIPASEELNSQAIYPSFSLKHIDKQPLNFKTEPSVEDRTPSKLNKSTTATKQDLEREASLHLTLK